jgi:large subunit ribosomal protein L9
MAIKLLLVDDVEDLGRSGDVVNVRPGFARNFLIPRKLGVIADKNALRRQARLQEERRQKAIQEKNEAEVIAASLEGITITTIVKVDNEGHMYGSVGIADIAHLLKEQNNVELEKRFIQLKHAFKEIGVHPVLVKLKEGISATLTLKIVPEEAK